MKPTGGRFPSAGFVAVCLTYLAVAAFFFWGLRTPPLDRAWILLNEMKAGVDARLGEADRELLQEVLRVHPALADALLEGGPIGLLSAHSEGWISTPSVVLLRTPGAVRQRVLRLDVHTAPDLLPLKARLRTTGFSKELHIAQQGILDLELPAPPAFPELIELRLGGKKLQADPSVLSVRLSFPEAP
jgi:hypothetical protein